MDRICKLGYCPYAELYAAQAYDLSCNDCQYYVEIDNWTEKPKPQTNADRIRAMSDEELAEFMCHNVSNGTVNCAFCAAEEFCRMGHNGWLDWLKQEVET